MQTARKPYIVKKAEELCEIINGIIALPRLSHWNELSDELLEVAATINRDYLTVFDFKQAYQDGLLTSEQSQIIEKFSRWCKRLYGD
jgi:hypothetical protein